MNEAARDIVLERLNEKYDLLIYKVAYGILHDADLVNDVKQTVLIKCMSRIEILSIMDAKTRAAYIATAARNTSIDELKKRSRTEETEERYLRDWHCEMTMDIVDFDAFEEHYGFGQEVWSLLCDLPRMDRELLVLKFYFCYSNGEIAEYFGTNKEQVKKRYQRAKGKLVKMIEERGVSLR